MLSSQIHHILGNYPFLVSLSYFAFTASMALIGLSLLGWMLKKSSEISPENLLGAFLGILAAKETISSLEFFIGKPDLSFGYLSATSTFWVFGSLKLLGGFILAYAFYSAVLKLARSFFQMTSQREPSQKELSHKEQVPVKKDASAISDKDILLDASSLSDPRILDLARSRFLDKLLVVPEGVVKELQKESGEGDEKAAMALEFLNQLQSLPHLQLRVDPDHRNASDLARYYGAKLLVRETGKLSSSEESFMISLNALASAMKPLARSGETLPIKIQRYGKEPRQGVGYLEDGSMVVVNGGAEYIGKTIEALVLSVKHTSSGRMIFCNTTDDEDLCLSHAAPKKPLFQHSMRSFIQE